MEKKNRKIYFTNTKIFLAFLPYWRVWHAWRVSGLHGEVLGFGGRGGQGVWRLVVGWASSVVTAPWPPLLPPVRPHRWGIFWKKIIPFLPNVEDTLYLGQSWSVYPTLMSWTSKKVEIVAFFWCFLLGFSRKLPTVPHRSPLSGWGRRAGSPLSYSRTRCLREWSATNSTFALLQILEARLSVKRLLAPDTRGYCVPGP